MSESIAKSSLQVSLDDGFRTADGVTGRILRRNKDFSNDFDTYNV